MSLETATSRVNIDLAGTGSYSLNLQCSDQTQIKVYHRSIADAQTLLVKDTDYTLDTANPITWVHFPTAGSSVEGECTSGNKLAVMRVVPLVQDTDYTGLENVFMPALEGDQDYLMMAVQQIQEQLDRAVLYTETYDGTMSDGEDIQDSADDAAASAVAAAASAVAAAASAAAALISENAAAADLLLTNADVVSTNADVVLTHADVVLTGADVDSTNADVLLTAADVVSTGLDVVATAADRVQTGLDVIATAADVVQTGLDTAATAQDVIDSAANAAAAAASAAIAFVNVKAHVQCITSTNKTLSGTWTEDGYAIQAGDRVAVNGQTDAAENGIYVAAAGAWSRSADFDEPDETILVNFYVRYGDVYAQTRWLQTGDVATIGVDDINFVLVATSGAAVEVQYAEAAHGFSVGQPVRYDGTNWVTAQADSEANAEMDGIVTDTLDGDNFKLAPVGEVDIADWSNAESSGSATLTVGQIYFLDPDTTGQIVDEDYLSLADGEVSKPIGKAVSTTKMMVYNYRGNVIGGGTAHSSSFVAGDITDNILTVVHGQNTLRPKIMFFDADNEPVIPASWSPTDDTNVNSSDITVSDEVIAQIGADTWRVEVDSTGVARTDNLSDTIPDGPTESGTAGTSEDRRRSDARDKAMPMCIWRMVVDEAAGNADPLGGGGTDWELSDDTETEYYLGSPVTESSGVFSFPSTGFWAIRVYATFDAVSGADKSSTLILKATNDNSVYTRVSGGNTGIQDTGRSTAMCEALLKITNLTNDKVRIQVVITDAQCTCQGDGDSNLTYIVFEKKCDLDPT